MKVVYVSNGVIIDGVFHPDSKEEKRAYAEEMRELDRLSEKVDNSFSYDDLDSEVELNFN